ncbi:MAG: DUF2237 domain-containing protein [Deltaproteobacteria bacterium]|nr:DUF2237 domain-containing protein [Deltaproteobacteria bacterium]
MSETEAKSTARNVLGTELITCSREPLTGWFRDGCCNTDARDTGVHTVCVRVTSDFLAFSKSVGNDLGAAVPEFKFPGLRVGDRWCLCASRWLEAYEAGKAPLVVMAATHERTLDVVPLEYLMKHAADMN